MSEWWKWWIRETPNQHPIVDAILSDTPVEAELATLTGEVFTDRPVGALGVSPPSSGEHSVELTFEFNIVRPVAASRVVSRVFVDGVNVRESLIYLNYREGMNRITWPLYIDIFDENSPLGAKAAALHKALFPDDYPREEAP
jgi:hypothetical protein